MIIHKLKIQKKYATDIYQKKKLFEVRKNDRNFQVGDYVSFNVIDNVIPFENEKEEITEVSHVLNQRLYRITYILSHEDFPEGINEGYVVMTIKEIKLVEA